jgi:uncharacterized phage protein gp47/JayE
MVQLRTIQQIQQEYFNGLARSGSGIVIDGVEGSLAYTLSRASAVVGSTLENKLLEVERQLSVTSATGEFLDNIGSAYLPRRSGIRAKGVVLAQSESDTETIPFGTTLIDIKSGLRYNTTSSPSRSVYPYIQSPISVEASEEGTAYNVDAGATLYSPTYPQVRFIVASQRYNNIYTGNITGGEDYESDEVYRRRLLSYFSTGNITTNSFLTQKLTDYSLISKAFVRTTSPGFVEIWLDSNTLYTQGQLDEIYNYVQAFLPLGVVPLISQLSRKSVSIELEVTPFNASLLDLNALSAQIRTAVEAYFDNLSMQEDLITTQLLNKVKPFVREVRMRTPAQNVIANVGEILAYSSIKLTYPVN